MGVNAAGLVLALLNRNLATRPPAPRARSRGLIIPLLLGHRRLAESLAAARALDPSQFDLFRLLAVQGRRAALITSDGRRLSVGSLHMCQPLMATSSSLGDALVEAPRRRLFERLVGGPPGSWLDGQARFHSHQWSRCRHVSVLMEREDAMTVSRTAIDVTSRTVVVSYEPLGTARQEETAA